MLLQESNENILYNLKILMMGMLTLNCFIEKKLPITTIVQGSLAEELIEENKDNNYSYLSLLKEFLQQKPTLGSLLGGYSGVELFKFN